MTDLRTVPLVDLAWQHQAIADEVQAGWDEVIASTSFILGDQVHRFEERYATFSGVQHCVGVASGTDALEMALRALAVGPGDEVVIPANTFIATALAVSRTGAVPVLADCDSESFLVTPETLFGVVTDRTRAIIPVHLYGQMAPVREIRDAFPGIFVIEDGAQSQGATRHGESSGSIGHIGATSFYPGKNIGAYGDAGAVLVDDDELATKVRALRNWGSDIKYHHPVKGFNSRLDTLQAVVLLAKLARLESWNQARANAADVYGRLLDGLPVTLPKTSPGNTHVWHLYVIQTENRDVVLKELNARGVGAGIHYPIPIHLQDAYEEMDHEVGAFPVAEQLASSCLSLPMHPGLGEEDQVYVANALREALIASGIS